MRRAAGIWRVSNRLLLGLATAAVMAASARAEVKIGVVGPLSGPQANSGIAMRKGFDLAAEEVNAKGGLVIGGKQQPVTLLFEDTPPVRRWASAPPRSC